MNKFLILIGFIITSCGAPERSTDKRFIEYTQRFTDYTGLFVNIPLNFSRLNGYIGVCITYIDGKKEIEIDSDFWADATDLAKEQLIFHELGHCVLNRDHDEELAQVNDFYYEIPQSIMYPYAFGGYSFYKSYHEHYIEELVDNNKKL